MKVTPCDSTLGAVVTGIDLRDLDDSTFERVSIAFGEFAVLVFPEQSISPDEQRAFAARFGDIEVAVSGDVRGNLRADGSQVTDDSDRTEYLKIAASQGWHTDSSYMPVSAKASVLSARTVVTQGGETEFADCRAAFDHLPGELRERAESHSAYHSIKKYWERHGMPPAPGQFGADVDEPPLRPLVKVHPDTGRSSLFMGCHAYEIDGLDSAASDDLLESLHDFTCQPPYTYNHKWSIGDVILWDNRCLLHRGRPYDLREPRLMTHTRVQGDPRTETAINYLP
jgi:alpha-ketoglutarate-dependent taurine dioxygenase